MQRLPVRFSRVRLLRVGLGLGRSRCGSLGALFQLAGDGEPQAFEQLWIGRRRLDAAFEIAEHLAYRRGGFQDHVHQRRAQMQLAVAQLVEEVFGEMAQGDELLRPQETRSPLDGVEAPEDLVQERAILGVALEFDELVVDSRE